jgi:hypothetical protein
LPKQSDLLWKDEEAQNKQRRFFHNLLFALIRVHLRLVDRVASGFRSTAIYKNPRAKSRPLTRGNKFKKSAKRLLTLSEKVCIINAMNLGLPAQGLVKIGFSTGTLERKDDAH